jgi:hypothetical protein
LKDPRSREYAIQTLYALRRYLESAEIDGRRVREELAEIDRYQHWKVLGYPSKKALLQAETGHTPEQIAQKLKPRGAPKGNQNASKVKPENKGDNITIERGTRAAYTLARLDRDAPELAAKVRAGDLSANAAAIEAGFRIKTFTVPLDADRAAAALKRYFTAGQLAKLRALL